jgi:hypothetical protein
MDDGWRIERFAIRVEGEEWPVSINHRRKAVKIQDVIYDLAAFRQLAQMGPLMARATHRVAQAIDGELLPPTE